jgi:hypothetical protein
LKFFLLPIFSIKEYSLRSTVLAVAGLRSPGDSDWNNFTYWLVDMAFRLEAQRRLRV